MEKDKLKRIIRNYTEEIEFLERQIQEKKIMRELAEKALGSENNRHECAKEDPFLDEKGNDEQNER